jgi:tripartite-type tricarboxylate transporter receptor subunit TctC
MKTSRREVLRLAAMSAALPTIARIGWAQTYPSRPVHLVVGFAPGGTNDILARLIGQRLTERLGQPLIIDNRPGAAGNIGTEAVVRAAPDGYTLLLADGAAAINATLYEKLNFSLKRDVSPIAAVMRVPFVVVVNPSFPAKTLPEFIAYAKANPNSISMASPGNGTPAHISGELFKMMNGIEMVHVPYRGAAPAVSDLLGGQVQVLFAAVPTVIEQIKAGKLRSLAATTVTRLEALPDVPTISEFTPGFEASLWLGVCAPKNLPGEIVDRLHHEINLALADPKIKARLAELGGAPMPLTTAEFTGLINDDIEKWAKVIKFAGLKAE